MKKMSIIRSLQTNRSVLKPWLTFSISEIDIALTNMSNKIYDEITIAVLLKQIIGTIYVLLLTDDTEDSRYNKWVCYLHDRFNYLGVTDVDDIVLTHIMSAVFEYALDVKRYGVNETTYSFIIDRLLTTLQNCYPKTNMIFDKKWRKLYA
jgi:hypothetical protein